MKRLLGSIGAQPLIYALALLSALAIVLGVYAERLKMRLDVANASSSSAMSLARLHQTERDAWKVRAEELGASVAAHQHANTALSAELKRAQEDAATLRQQDARALAQARAATAEADRTLAAFMSRYHAQIRAPACDRALDQLEAACPALSRY